MLCGANATRGKSLPSKPATLPDAREAFQQHRASPESREFFDASLSYLDALTGQLGCALESVLPLRAMLKAMDSKPPWWQREDSAAVLSRYVSVIQGLCWDPDASEDTISELMDNLEFRLVRAGLPARPVIWLRYQYVVLARGVREAEDWFDQWMELDPSPLCPCRGCDPARLVDWLIRDSRMEAAARLTESFLSNSARIMCGNQPHGLLAAGLAPLLHTRRMDAARQAALLSLRLAAREPDQDTLLTLAATLARCGQMQHALALVDVSTSCQPHSRFGEASNMAKVARVLVAAPAHTAPGTFWPGFSGTANDVAMQLVSAAYNTAECFDRRHGTDSVSLQVRHILAAEDLPTLDIPVQPRLRRAAPSRIGEQSRTVDPSRTGKQSRSATGTPHPSATPDAGDAVSPVARALHVRANLPSIVGQASPDELQRRVRAAFVSGTAAELTALLGVWTAQGTAQQAQTTAGIWLDCVAHCHDPDLDPRSDPQFLDRAAAHTSATGTAATTFFVRSLRLCTQDSWNQSELDFLAEQLSNVALLSDDVLAPIAVAQIIGAAVRLGHVSFLKANKPVFSAALGRTPAGQQVYLQWNMLSRGKDPRTCREPMEQVSAACDHGSDWMMVFCTRVAERCAALGDVVAAVEWLDASRPYIVSATCESRLIEVLSAVDVVMKAAGVTDQHYGGGVHTQPASSSQNPKVQLVTVPEVADVLSRVTDQLLLFDVAVPADRGVGLLKQLIFCDARLAALEWGESLLAQHSGGGTPTASPSFGSHVMPGQSTAPEAAQGDASRQMVLSLVAVASDRLGDHEAATDFAGQAISASTASPQVWHLAAAGAYDAGEVATAVNRFATAAELSLRQGSMRQVVHCVASEAECSYRDADLQSALVVIDRWQDTFRQPRAEVADFGSWSQLAIAVAKYAVLSEHGDYEGSLRWAQEAVGHADRIGHPEVLLQARRRCLAALWAAGRTRDTLGFAEAVLDHYDPSSRHPALWDCAQAYATLAESLGEPGKAAHVRQEYLGSVDVPHMSLNVALDRDVTHRGWPGA